MLADGRCLCSLEDAARMILALPPKEQAQLRWQNAAGMLTTAIETGRDDHAALATMQIERALTWAPPGSVRLAEESLHKKPPARSIRRRQVLRDTA